MKKLNSHSSMEGIGGWLALLQIRLCVGLLALFVLPVSPVLAVLLGGTLIVCLLLFYQYRIAFRGAYIAAAALGIVAGISLLSISVVYLIVLSALEVAVIPALFASRRVRNTFDPHPEDSEAIHSGWHGRAPHRCCYDVHIITNRFSR